MRILRTGHPIADTIADSIPDMPLDADIGYGILRGNAEVFKGSPCWFNIDRGYFHPGHFDGYYRVSLRGTQQTRFWPEPDYDRMRALRIDTKPWRGFDHSKPVLVVPPTKHVMQFFGLHHWKHPYGVISTKGHAMDINFQDYSYIYTFNSSLGWQALMAGIPCISDTTHSIVGSYFNNLSLDQLAEAQYVDRERLFAIMSGLQLTLKEMREGKLWTLVEMLYGLAGMTVRPLPQT